MHPSLAMLMFPLLQIAANPAAASWLPRSFLKGFTPHPTPTSSHASYLTAQNHSTMSVDPLSLSAGSYLSALDQCGGTGGFCNRTTIGVPCGDRQWPGSYCPEDYECIRSNSSYWQCTLMPGRYAICVGFQLELGSVTCATADALYNSSSSLGIDSDLTASMM